jgi:3-hydroxybutyryl-CoA dehydrogenase
MPSNKIVILGAGMIGQGLAEAIATAGNEVILLDKNIKIAQNGLDKVGESIDHAIARWATTKSEKKATLSRITAAGEMPAASEAGIVIEAVPENLNIKKDAFKKLDQICPADTVFITTTATLPINDLAAASGRPDRFIGMIFVNPVPQIPVVEIIRADKTSDSTYQRACEFAEMLGKTTIASKEQPGHITIRLIVPLLNEAMNVLLEGVASVEDIDKAMKLGYGFNIGPLALADRIGLDLVLCWMENLASAKDHECHACLLLTELIKNGQLGVKSGIGFYKYDKNGNRRPNEMLAGFAKGISK